MGKIKKFVKEHKKEIGLAVVAGAVTVGCVILHKKANVGVVKFSKCKNKEFVKAIEAADKKSRIVAYGEDMEYIISDLGKAGEDLVEIFADCGIVHDTKINGILVMTD